MTTLALDSNTLPALTMRPNPLTLDGLRRCAAEFLPGETLGRYMERNEIGLPSTTYSVWHNGFRVPAPLWRRLIPRTGDHVVIAAHMPRGGGGGNKVIRTAAMIALVAASIYAPYAAGLYEVVGGVKTLTMAGSLLSAGVMIGGTLMISPLFPEVTQ